MLSRYLLVSNFAISVPSPSNLCKKLYEYLVANFDIMLLSLMWPHLLSYLEDTTAIRYLVKEKAIPTVSCELTSSPLSINILLSCFQLHARLEIQNWFFLGARAFFRAEIGRARARDRPRTDLFTRLPGLLCGENRLHLRCHVPPTNASLARLDLKRVIWGRDATQPRYKLRLMAWPVQ